MMTAARAASPRGRTSPLEVLRHDPAVYATGRVWSEKVEALWGADQAAFATLTPRGKRHGRARFWSQRLPRRPSSLGHGGSAGAQGSGHEAVSSRPGCST